MIRIIANPAAGRGRARRVIPSAHAAFSTLGAVDVRETRAANDEARLVREALDDGCRTIVALGGDGTWSKIAAAIVSAGSACRLALLAAGTGNDLAKSLGVPAGDPLATARLVASGVERRIDVGEVDGRIFINSAGFAFDAAVLQAMVGRRWPPGNALYLSCALEQILRFPGVDISLGAAFRRHLLLVVANGRRFGGSFTIAPIADLGDGMLDIIEILDAPPLRRARLFAAALRGTHVGLPEVEQRQAKSINLRFREPPLFQLDGDLYSAARPELVVRCLPASLNIVSGARAAPAATTGSAR